MLLIKKFLGALFFIINLCSYTEFLLHHFDAFHCRKILKLLRKIGNLAIFRGLGKKKKKMHRKI